MNEHDAESFDDVPTLVNLVVPGDAEKRRADEPSSEATPEQPAQAYPADSAQAGKYNFRSSIDNMIEEVLNRHMVHARKEITSRVIAEIVSHRNRRS